jgi:hypothetical protein
MKTKWMQPDGSLVSSIHTLPRVCSFMLQRFHPRYGLASTCTWIEAEEFCYPGGGMHRRCRAICPDGKLRIFRCGLPDTAFSIPTEGGKGYITNDMGEYRFIPFTGK